MNKIYVLLAAVIFFPYTLFCQKQKVLEIQTEVEGRKFYKARDTIRLLPGFKTSSPSPIEISINEAMILPVEYQNVETEPETRILDKSKITGTISGISEVSSTGAATYSIPIFTPPGTAGMQPDITIQYNSQGGNGTLGFGWEIGGLSAITRTYRSPLFDGEYQYVNLSQYDAFSWDGNRLIEINYTTPTEYATLTETFTAIKAHKESDGNPLCFEIITKEGIQLDYGKRPDSRIEVYGGDGTSKTLMWRLEKMTDQNGNYITYHYGSNKFGDSRIDSIVYTGNEKTGLKPYNKIEFLYESRRYEKAFLGGRQLMLNPVLLRGINIICDGEKVRSYRFTYKKPENKQAHTGSAYLDILGPSVKAQYKVESPFSYLVEIREIIGNEEPNSTLIEWGKPFTPTVIEPIRKINSSIGNNKIVHTAYGDFNGDGRTDCFVISNEGDLDHRLHLFLTDSSGTTQIEVANSGFRGYTTCYVSPPDKNGKVDFIIQFTEKTNNIFNPKYTHTYTRYIYNPANQRLEPIIIYEEENIYNSTWRLAYGNGYHNWAILAGGEVLKKGVDGVELPDLTGIDGVQLVDFNGDGILDLVVLKGKRMNIYGKADKNYLLYSGERTLKQYYGDFNGDGKTDILQFTGNLRDTVYTCRMLLSTGKDFQILDNPVHIGDNVIIGDFNGDGKDDIFTNRYVEYPGLDYPLLHGDIFYSRGDNTFMMENIYIAKATKITGNGIIPPMYVPGYMIEGGESHDLNGDGKQQIIPTHRECLLDSIITIRKNNISHLVTSITDGYNRKTEFKYSTLSKGKYYNQTPDDYGDDFCKTSNPMYITSSMIESVEDNIVSAMDYKYEDALLLDHLPVRTFAGFRRTISYNHSTNNTKESIYDYDYRKNKFLNREVVYLGDDNTNLVSQVNYIHDTKMISRPTYHMYLTQTKEIESIDHLSGNRVTEKYLYDNVNNITEHKTIFTNSNSTEEIISTINYEYRKKNEWHAPQSQVTRIATSLKYADNESYIRSSEYDYDDYGNKIYEKSDLGVEVVRQFNDYGLVEKMTKIVPGFEVATVRTRYDEKKRFVISSTDTLGTVYSEYDPKNGLLLSETDIDGKITCYRYDHFGRLQESTNYRGHQIRHYYHWSSDHDPGIYYTVNVADAQPTLWNYYDALGREIEIRTENFNNEIIYVRKEYDQQGRLWRKSHPFYEGEEIRWIEMTYDEYGRLKILADQDLITEYFYEGNKTTVKSPDGKITQKRTNAKGDIVESKDDGGTISYTYHSSGQPMEISTSGLAIKYEYDRFGRRISMNNPNTGKTHYEYDPVGNLVLSINQKKDSTLYFYDGIGRISRISYPEESLEYTYDAFYKNVIISVLSNRNSGKKYEYNTDGTLRKLIEIINGENYETAYEYDEFDNITTITYPDNFTITHHYTDKSFMTLITAGDQLLWRKEKENASGLPLRFTLGNSKTTHLDYDRYNQIIHSYTDGVQDLHYQFDARSGNLQYRMDKFRNRNLREDFKYDSLHRLTTIAQNNVTILDLEYDASGNITKKSDVGVYKYGSQKPHAVTEITGYPVSGLSNQTIRYTSFDKACLIEEGKHKLSINYGIEHERIESQSYFNNQLIRSKYYANNYEKVIIFDTNTSNYETVHYNYISTPNGIRAVFIQKEGASGYFYYLYPDYLGSIMAITGNTGHIVEEKSYDAWGNSRNPSTWENTPDEKFRYLDRGYTFHEHLPSFGLINMNGRLYDPLVARFLSADPLIQDPGHSQGLNSYSYCLNNPLKYTDPSGNIAEATIATAIISSMVISTASYTISVALSPGGFRNWNTATFLQTLGIGAVSGGMTFAIGSVFSGVVPSSFGSKAFLECTKAVFHGGLGAITSGGDHPGRAFLISAGSSLFYSGLSMTGIQSKALKIASSTLTGGIVSVINGGKFIEGAARGLTVSLLNHAMHALGDDKKPKKRTLASHMPSCYPEGGADGSCGPTSVHWSTMGDYTEEWIRMVTKTQEGPINSYKMLNIIAGAEKKNLILIPVEPNEEIDLSDLAKCMNGGAEIYGSFLFPDAPIIDDKGNREGHLMSLVNIGEQDTRKHGTIPTTRWMDPANEGSWHDTKGNSIPFLRAIFILEPWIK